MRDTSDAPRNLRLVSETRRNAEDVGDGRRRAHNPATLVCGLGFDVVLGGKLENPRRGIDRRFGRLQDRIPAGYLPALEGVADVARNRVFAWHHQLRGSSISARNACRMAWSRVQVALSAGFLSEAGCSCLRSVSLGIGSAERRGSIVRSGVVRRQRRRLGAGTVRWPAPIPSGRPRPE